MVGGRVLRECLWGGGGGLNIFFRGRNSHREIQKWSENDHFVGHKWPCARLGLIAAGFSCEPFSAGGGIGHIQKNFKSQARSGTIWSSRAFVSTCIHDKVGHEASASLTGKLGME